MRTEKKFLLTFTFPKSTLSKCRTSEPRESVLAMVIFETMSRILINDP